MLKKTVLTLVRIILSLISFFIVSSLAIYYIFLFDWHISFAGKIFHTAIVIIVLAVSVIVYWFAERIRRINYF